MHVQPLIDPASAALVAAGKNASDSQAGWSGSDLAEIVVPAAANEAITVTVVVPTVAAGYLKWYDPQGTLLGGQQVTHKTCTKPCVFVFNSAAAGLYRLEVATATVVVTLNRPAGVDVRTSDFTRGGSYYFAVQHPSPLVVAWSGDAPGGAVTVTDPNGVPSTLLTETDVSFAAPAVGLWKVTIPPGSASNRSLGIFGSAPLVWYNGANVLTTP